MVVWDGEVVVWDGLVFFFGGGVGHSPDISTSHSEDCQAWPPLCTRQSLAGVIRRGSCENVYSTEAAQRNPLHHIYTHKRTQAHADTHACIGGSIFRLFGYFDALPYIP